MMEYTCTHPGIRHIHMRSSTVSSCAALWRWSIPFGCCLHCGDLLCSRRLFLHVGNCLGDVSDLRDCIHCCSASCRYSAVAAVGNPVGSGWSQVGDVRLASCHMPFVVHSIQSVFVSTSCSCSIRQRFLLRTHACTFVHVGLITFDIRQVDLFLERGRKIVPIMVYIVSSGVVVH